ncbi:MAG: calcium-binding protein [Elainella sp.]
MAAITTIAGLSAGFTYVYSSLLESRVGKWFDELFNSLDADLRIFDRKTGTWTGGAYFVDGLTSKTAVLEAIRDLITYADQNAQFPDVSYGMQAELYLKGRESRQQLYGIVDGSLFERLGKPLGIGEADVLGIGNNRSYYTRLSNGRRYLALEERDSLSLPVPVWQRDRVRAEFRTFQGWQIAYLDDAGNIQAIPTIAANPNNTPLLKLGNRNDNQVGGAFGADYLNGEAGNDSLKGNQGDDTLLGGEGKDNIQADEGNDIAFGGAGQDTIIGGAGNDQLFGGSYDLTSGTWSNDDAGDNLYGGEGNDSLYGNTGWDYLSGGNGDDLLVGHTIFPTASSSEADTLVGNAGRDRFVLGSQQGRYYSNGSTEIEVWGKGERLALKVAPKDYAFLPDFNPSEGDVIVLKGAASQYKFMDIRNGEFLPSGNPWLQYFPANNTSAAIVLDKNQDREISTGDEVVGILGGYSSSSLSFQSGFQFV